MVIMKIQLLRKVIMIMVLVTMMMTKMIMVMVADLSGGREEYPDAGEGHEGGRDAYQACQRFLRQIVVIIILVYFFLYIVIIIIIMFQKYCQ